MLDKTVIIYGLIDPRSNQLFYVGKTHGKLSNRLRVHRQSPKLKNWTRASRMIGGIISAGFALEHCVLENALPTEWIEAEQFWIAYFRFIGCRLANHTIGGEGLTGVKRSRESMEKTRLAHVGALRSDETKALIRASWTPERKATHIAFCKTRIMPDHQRLLLSKIHKGKTISAAQRAQISAAHRGRKLSVEQRAKLAAVWTPERRLAQSIRFTGVRRNASAKTPTPMPTSSWTETRYRWWR